MTNEFGPTYQYDRCTSRGICSINPTTASLQEVILLYLKHAGYYGLKLEEAGIKDVRIRNLVLNTISILNSSYEISENNFEIIKSAFLEELPRIIKEFDEFCDGEKLDTETLLAPKNSLNDYIRYGEKEFNKRIQNIPTDERNLYKILFILTKSLCINLLTYESYGHSSNDEIKTVFSVFNLLNTPKKDKSELKEIILDIASKDYKLMNYIRSAQEKAYGKPEEKEVSFSTTKGKAVLVVGSNLKELEIILDKFEDKNIDVYTHDNLISAHTFPAFGKYKHLKGQFGKGMENCLLDFSTFPGPIILLKHSLFNIESLYRGHLFTTDFAYSKGVRPIKDYDFTEVIKSAQESKGFKTGKVCEPEKVGFSKEKILERVKNILKDNNYKNLIIVGSDGYSAEEKEYFDCFFKHIPDDILVIYFACCEERKNLICLNTSGDIYSMPELIDEINDVVSQNITLLFPFIDRHTLSIILKLSSKNNKIFIGRWKQNTINPNILESLEKDFNINELSTPKNDWNRLLATK